jgi:hypothetical protein
MGIKQLMSIIKDEAPDAVKEGEIKNQFGRKVAIVSRVEPGIHHHMRNWLTVDTGCVCLLTTWKDCTVLK